MMNYEIFKEVVADTFKDYLPEQYRDMEMRVLSVNKVNRMMDGINLIGGKDDRLISPTIYINDMYDHYKACNDLKEAIQTGAERMVNAFRKCPEAPRVDLADAKDNIVFQLVNTEQNRELLAGVPHREFQDLSILYRWVVKMDQDGIQSTIVKNELAENLGLQEEQLFKLASENTRRILPPCVKSMNEILREMFMKDGMPQEIAEMMVGEMPADQMMWVISNERGINGAISMLYEDKLHALAEQLENDLYILPSSIHEVIAVSASMGEPNELAQMVAEINMAQVSLEERLSNQVYHYDKDLRKLSLATDTPNKRLDGIVAEPPMVYETKQSR
ncbi:MAG: hypothetical protein J6D08_18060 [Lachnospiraceae bacterium]|nr:hypothetical protein [Lachnospiraceae bacterium]